MSPLRFHHKMVLSFLTVGLCGFGGCSEPVAELCQDVIPAYEKQLQDARVALAPSVPGADRRLASVGAESPSQEIGPWTEWAEARLKEAQLFLDVAEENLPREVQREISTLANQLVRFHGYSQRGDAARMLTTLDEVLEQGRKVRGLACTKP